jgi:hypothetical protein
MSCFGDESQGRACRNKVVGEVAWDSANTFEYCKKHGKMLANNVIKGSNDNYIFFWALKELGYINDNSR